MTIENKNIDLLYSDLTEDLYNLYKKSKKLKCVISDLILKRHCGRMNV